MTAAIRKVNLTEMFGRFQDQWKPKIVGEVNDSFVKLVKLKGEFVWHHHDHEDEMFLVVKGRLRMQLRDREIHVAPGEFIIIPHGVEHKPVADDETDVSGCLGRAGVVAYPLCGAFRVAATGSNFGWLAVRAIASAAPMNKTDTKTTQPTGRNPSA